MSVGTATAIGIAAAASAGAGVASAEISAHAAKSAAQTQAASANHALDLQTGIYQQQRALVDPYVQAGAATFGQLVNRYNSGGFQLPGMNPMPATAPRPAPAGMPTVAPSGVSRMAGLAGGQLIPAAAPTPLYGGAPAPQGASLAMIAAPTYPAGSAAPAAAQTMGSLAAALPTAQPPAVGTGPMVLLRAPTGEIGSVPASQAPAFLARGAVRIG